MRRITTLIFGMILGGGLVFSSYQYHLVRTGEQFLLIPKQVVSLVDPYVDVREWDLEDWEKHPELLKAMKAQGHGDLLPDGDESPDGETTPTQETQAADHESLLPGELVLRNLIPRSSKKDDGKIKHR